MVRVMIKVTIDLAIKLASEYLKLKSVNKTAMALLWFFLCLGAFGCEKAASLKEATLGFVANQIPVPVIENLDKHSWQSLAATHKTVETAEAVEALRELASPLIKAAEQRSGPLLQWDFHIVVSPTVNAFALPGGTIGVNSGLLEFSKGGSEFVGILGHEVAHVYAKHGLKALVLQSGLSIGLPIALSFVIGDLGQFSGMAVNQIAQLGVLKFSRDQEREADNLGAALLADAGYPSAGLAEFFQEMHGKQNAGKGQLSQWDEKSLNLLSTHPMSVERSKNLQELAATNSKRELNPAELARYQTLRRVTLNSLSPEDRKKHESKN